MSCRPYRTHWRIADRDTLEEASRSDGRLDDPYRSYEEERVLIAEWESADEDPPPTLLSRWIFHPDERARAELTRPKTYSWLDPESGKRYAYKWAGWKEDFLDRIVQEMRAEGVYWTPLVETISHVDWPALRYIADAAENAIGAWLEEHASKEHIFDLIHSFSRAFIPGLVLRRTRGLDLEMVREIFKKARIFHSSPAIFFVALGKNPFLSPDQVAGVTEWLVDEWEAELRGASSLIRSAWTYIPGFLREQNHAIPNDQLLRAFSLAELARKLSAQDQNSTSRQPTPHSQTTPSESSNLAGFSFLAERIILDSLSVAADVLSSLVRYIPRQESVLSRFVAHPNVDERVLRIAFDTFPTSSTIRERVAKCPSLRWDPKIRKRLLRSSNPVIVAVLAEDAEPEVAAHLIRRLLAKNLLDLAARALSARAPDMPVALHPADLAPMLRSAQQDIRLTALTWLGRLTTSSSFPPTTTVSGLKRPAIKRHIS